MKTVGDLPLPKRIVVVTGGGSGINLAFARLANTQGASVIIADLRLTDEAEEFVKLAENVVFAKCDVVNWEDLQNLIDVSKKEFGDVPDVYIAGAAVFEPTWSNFWSDTETSRYASLDINVSHPIKLTRIAMRALLSKNKPGVVLIVSSVAGLQGYYAPALYSTAKHAIIGFVKCMASADQEEGVKVVCICPSIVKTPLWTASPDQMAQYSFNEAYALTPEAVAEAMLELVQDGQYGGGTVLRIAMEGKEVVAFEDGAGGKLPGADMEQVRKMLDKTHEPVREILRKERGGG
ncbi:hypothetical protein MMC06_006378 [Schaereria dolodes]|nr:hypothetical protein [Schaereria dolodes]